MRKIDLSGRRFGRLTVLSEDPQRRYRHVCWICACSCGTVKSISGISLRAGASLSCGCLTVETTRARITKHGMTSTPEFKAWQQLITRCTNPSNPAYAEYGDRGIRVCEEWLHDFEAFFAEVGPRPTPDHSIDRKNTNGHYEPGNCRWSTRREQNKNTRRSRHWTVLGKTFDCSRTAAAHFGVDPATINRWCNGYSQDGQRFPAKAGCWSQTKYEVSP